VVTNCIKFLEFKKFPNVIFTQDDEESLAKTLIRALEETFRITLDVPHFKEYSWNAVAAKTLSCYQTILAREDNPR